MTTDPYFLQGGYTGDTRAAHADFMMHISKATKTARAALPAVPPRGSVPLPRRWARAKAWCYERAAEPPDVQHIKLMLQAERANRG
jgi:hypothetical protein